MRGRCQLSFVLLGQTAIICSRARAEPARLTPLMARSWKSTEIGCVLCGPHPETDISGQKQGNGFENTSPFDPSRLEFMIVSCVGAVCRLLNYMNPGVTVPRFVYGPHLARHGLEWALYRRKQRGKLRKMESRKTKTQQEKLPQIVVARPLSVARTIKYERRQTSKEVYTQRRDA